MDDEDEPAELGVDRVAVSLGGSIDLVVGSANVGDLFPAIAGAGSIAGLFDNANVPAPASAGSCYRFTAADGSVWVPEMLRPYLGGREVLEPVAK